MKPLRSLARRKEEAPAAPKVPAPEPADPAALAGASCSICLAPLDGSSPAVRCPSCRLPYHDECWRENLGCGAFGCPLAPEAPKEEVEGPVQTAWGDTKKCPRCAKEIQAVAIKCRHCKADLGTRDALSSKEWREMDRKRKSEGKGRTLAVACFLMSATCLLAPVGAGISAWQVADRSRREALEDADRFLHFGSLGVAALEVLLLGAVKAFGW